MNIRPQREVQDTAKRLHNVSLPLTDVKAEMATNGLAAAYTSISFNVQKSYPNSIEAKNDIIKHLVAAGIKAPQPTDAPEFIFPATTHIDAHYDFEKYVFRFFTVEKISCDNAEAKRVQCDEIEFHSTPATERLNNLPVRYVSVRALIEY